LETEPKAKRKTFSRDFPHRKPKALFQVPPETGLSV